MTSDDLPVLPFASSAAWETWLEANHASAGVWIQMAKKSTRPGCSSAERDCSRRARDAVQPNTPGCSRPVLRACYSRSWR